MCLVDYLWLSNMYPESFIWLHFNKIPGRTALKHTVVFAVSTLLHPNTTFHWNQSCICMGKALIHSNSPQGHMISAGSHDLHRVTWRVHPWPVSAALVCICRDNTAVQMKLWRYQARRVRGQQKRLAQSRREFALCPKVKYWWTSTTAFGDSV